MAPYVVAPVAMPQSDGTIKLGAGVAEIDPDQLQAARREARATFRSKISEVLARLRSGRVAPCAPAKPQRKKSA
jgi:hypothetical protein